MNCFSTIQKGSADEHYTRLKQFYMHSSPTQMLYNLKTTYIKLVPAIIPNDTSTIDSLHIFFLNTGGLTCLLDILTQKKFTEQCDMITKKSIYWIIFCILKRFLIILGYYQLKISNSTIHQQSLDHILTIMPMTTMFNEQHVSISLERHMAILLQKYIGEYPIPKNSVLQYDHIIEFIRLIWCLASNNKQISFDVNLKKDFNAIHKIFKQENVSLIFKAAKCRSRLIAFQSVSCHSKFFFFRTTELRKSSPRSQECDECTSEIEFSKFNSIREL
jgi:hypothetical protein